MIRLKLFIITACCMASFAGGYSRHEVHTVTKEVMVETLTNTCSTALPDWTHAKKYKARLDVLAAAIPVGALRP